MLYQTVHDPVTSVVVAVRREHVVIPCDPANADYQQYLAWVEAGNTAEPWEPDNAN